MNRVSAVLRSRWQLLAEPQRPLRYLGICLLFDLPIALLLALIVQATTGDAFPTFPGYSLAQLFVILCLATPFLETMIFAGVIEIVRLFSPRPMLCAAIAAAIAAAFHSASVPTWGLVIAWPFFLQAVCYLTWQQRSWTWAIALTTALHGLHNLFPTLLVAVQRQLSA